MDNFFDQQKKDLELDEDQDDSLRNQFLLLDDKSKLDVLSKV